MGCEGHRSRARDVEVLHEHLPVVVQANGALVVEAELINARLQHESVLEVNGLALALELAEVSVDGNEQVEGSTGLGHFRVSGFRFGFYDLFHSWLWTGWLKRGLGTTEMFKKYMVYQRSIQCSWLLFENPIS